MLFIHRAYQGLLLGKSRHNPTGGSACSLLPCLLPTNQLTEDEVPFPGYCLHLSKPLLQSTAKTRQPQVDQSLSFRVYNLGLWLSTHFLRGVSATGFKLCSQKLNRNLMVDRPQRFLVYKHHIFNTQNITRYVINRRK